MRSVREELELRAAAEELRAMLDLTASRPHYHFCHRVGKFVNAILTEKECGCAEEAQARDSSDAADFRFYLAQKNANSASPEAHRPDSPLALHVARQKDIQRELSSCSNFR